MEELKAFDAIRASEGVFSPGVDIIIKSRKRDVVIPRQVAHYILKKYSRLSNAKVGELIGQKDHATVLHSRKTVSNLMDVDKEFKEKVLIAEAMFLNFIDKKDELNESIRMVEFLLTQRVPEESKQVLREIRYKLILKNYEDKSSQVKSRDKGMVGFSKQARAGGLRRVNSSANKQMEKPNAFVLRKNRRRSRV